MMPAITPTMPKIIRNQITIISLFFRATAFTPSGENDGAAASVQRGGGFFLVKGSDWSFMKNNI